MNDMTLYEVAAEFSALVEKEDLTDEDFEKLDEYGHAIEIKAGNIAALTDKLSAFASYCKEEEQRIAAKRKAVENRSKRILQYLQDQMEIAGVMEVEIGTRKISLQPSPHKLIIDDEKKIPQIFFDIVPQTLELDKAKLKKALKKEEIEGAHLTQGYHLRKR